MSNDYDFLGGSIQLHLRDEDIVQPESEETHSVSPDAAPSETESWDASPWDEPAPVPIPSTREEQMLRGLARETLSAVVRVLREEAAKLPGRSSASSEAIEEDVTLLAKAFQRHRRVPGDLGVINRMLSEAIFARRRILKYYGRVEEIHISHRTDKIVSHELVLAKYVLPCRALGSDSHSLISFIRMREAYDVLTDLEEI